MKTTYKLKYILIFTIFFSQFIISGCEEEKEPVTSSEFIITVNSLNQSDINENNVIEKDENISNNSGNPWGEFIDIAQAECISDPGGFQILGVSVQLVPKDGIDRFEDFVSGKLSVDFINTQNSDMDAERVVIASKNNPSGIGPIDLENLASRSELSLLNDRLIGGDFHVGITADTHLNDNDSFAFDVIIRFQVRAYCE
jgi:hypothetical protein